MSDPQGRRPAPEAGPPNPQSGYGYPPQQSQGHAYPQGAPGSPPGYPNYPPQGPVDNTPPGGAGYPPHGTPGYPPAGPPGYPPPQPGYPQQQAGPGYPPPGYPLAQHPGYPPQTQPYPMQGYPPQGYPPPGGPTTVVVQNYVQGPGYGYNPSALKKDTALGLGVLGFFVVPGLHRFYLKEYGMGVLYLLTGGLCFIGTLIDVIRLSSMSEMEFHQRYNSPMLPP